MTADHLNWRLVLPELRERFTIYAVDLRGRGDSGDDSPLEREVQDVVALIG